MSEKVMITQEQADAVEFGAKNQPRHKLIDAYFGRANLDFTGELLPLKNMNYDQFFGSLYGDYEVEPEFEVGQFVTDTTTNITKEIKDEDMARFLNWEYIRKEHVRRSTLQEIAQEKERRASRKIDELLLSLSNHERVMLHEKLNCSDPT